MDWIFEFCEDFFKKFLRRGNSIFCWFEFEISIQFSREFYLNSQIKLLIAGTRKNVIKPFVLGKPTRSKAYASFVSVEIEARCVFFLKNRCPSLFNSGIETFLTVDLWYFFPRFIWRNNKRSNFYIVCLPSSLHFIGIGILSLATVPNSASASILSECSFANLSYTFVNSISNNRGVNLSRMDLMP